MYSEMEMSEMDYRNEELVKKILVWNGNLKKSMNS
jgi:hypothetical protein